jgi:hypothetical protein
VKNKQQQPKSLIPFVGGHRQNMPKGIAYHLKDYCELVDLTGRCISEDNTVILRTANVRFCSDSVCPPNNGSHLALSLKNTSVMPQGQS